MIMIIIIIIIIKIYYPRCLFELLFDDGVIASFNLPPRVRDHRLGVEDHLCSAKMKGLDLAILQKREQTSVYTEDCNTWCVRML